MTILLRPTEPEDLTFFFEFQLNEEAAFLAAFTPKDRTDKQAYLAKHTKFLSDPDKHTRTIVADHVIVGSIAKFEVHGEAEITYWLDRKYWNRGIGTTALKTFLTLEHTRPLFARTAFDNYGSQKILEKCGFIKIGEDRGFANAREQEIEEFIFELTA